MARRVAGHEYRCGGCAGGVVEQDASASCVVECEDYSGYACESWRSGRGVSGLKYTLRVGVPGNGGGAREVGVGRVELALGMCGSGVRDGGCITGEPPD